MASVGDAQERQDGDGSCEPDDASFFGRAEVAGLMDVVFGGTALALLLMWIVLAIAGRLPT